MKQHTRLIVIIFLSLIINAVSLNAENFECKEQVSQKIVNKFFLKMITNYKENDNAKLQQLINNTEKNNQMNLKEILEEIFSYEWKVSVRISDDLCKGWINFIYIQYSEDKKNSSESNVGLEVKLINNNIKITNFFFAG